MRFVTSAPKFVVKVASALVRFVTSAAKFAVKVASALVRFVTSAPKFVVKVASAAALMAASLAMAAVAAVALASTYVLTAFCVGYNTSLVPRAVAVDLLLRFSFNKSAFVRFVTSAAKFVVKVASALVRFVTSAAKFVVKVASAAALMAASLDTAAVAAVALASTYVFTAFCVGYNTSLVPKAVAVDLLLRFSFNKSALVRLVTSAAKFVVNTASALMRFVSSMSKCEVSTESAAARIRPSLLMASAVVAVNTSTYVFTAF